jgi:hypothetical protein
MKEWIYWETGTACLYLAAPELSRYRSLAPSHTRARKCTAAPEFCRNNCCKLKRLPRLLLILLFFAAYTTLRQSLVVTQHAISPRGACMLACWSARSSSSSRHVSELSCGHFKAHSLAVPLGLAIEKLQPSLACKGETSSDSFCTRVTYGYMYFVDCTHVDLHVR